MGRGGGRSGGLKGQGHGEGLQGGSGSSGAHGGSGSSGAHGGSGSLGGHGGSGSTGGHGGSNSEAAAPAPASTAGALLYPPQKNSFFLTESALKKQQSRTDAPFLFHLPRKESDIFFPHLWPVNILIAIAIVLHVYSMYVFGNLCVARLSCFLSLSVNSHYWMFIKAYKW